MRTCIVLLGLFTASSAFAWHHHHHHHHHHAGGGSSSGGSHSGGGGGGSAGGGGGSEGGGSLFGGGGPSCRRWVWVSHTDGGVDGGDDYDENSAATEPPPAPEPGAIAPTTGPSLPEAVAPAAAANERPLLPEFDDEPDGGTDDGEWVCADYGPGCSVASPGARPDAPAVALLPLALLLAALAVRRAVRA
jgi:MYXO-CTERM domain-containing protein